MRNAKVLVLLTASVSAAASCALLPSFDLDAPGAGKGGATGSSASTSTTTASVSTDTSSTSVSTSTSSTGGSEKCGLTFPSYPSGADEGGDFTFTAAIHSINLGDKGVVGIDLDQTCSCHGMGASCIEPTEHCDDEAGRDNSASALFNSFALVLGSATFSSAGFTGQAEAGNWSILYRVKGYNGMANDAKVELDWYLSTGFDRTTVSKPQWDGTDKWKIAASHVNNSNLEDPIYRDTHAYVSNNMLVASIPETPIPLPVGDLGRLSLTLSSAGLIARVLYDTEYKAYVLVDGQVVGRIKLTNIFKTLSSFRDTKGKTFCTNNPFYGIAKTDFCDSADILSVPGTPSLPCDAISFAVGFTADPAVLGAVDATVPSTTPGCSKETDPAGDKCSP